MTNTTKSPTAAHRVRKAWRVRVKGYDESGIVHAPTAGKARTRIWHQLDGVGRIVDITACREPFADVILPPRDPVADELTKDEAHCLLHAFGADQGDPEKAGYRDYFYTRLDDPPLVALAVRGLMSIQLLGEQTHGKDMAYFVLTLEGKRVALSMVPEYRA